MDIDIHIGTESLTVFVENPHRFDVSHVFQRIYDFGMKFGVDLNALKIGKLIPEMVRGVAGCEGGCPADAKSLVRTGFGDFTLAYIEGGILSASYNLHNGKSLVVKIFPDFH
jgi:hypothetical protein